MSRTRHHLRAVQSARAVHLDRNGRGQRPLRAGDFRVTDPRFAQENRSTNLGAVDRLKALAQQKSCRPGQLALAWLLAQPFDIVPIPDTKRIEYVRENLAATAVAVSLDETAYLASIFAPDRIAGARYAPNDAGRR